MAHDNIKGKVIFIVGPTAVGKTAVAIQLAKALKTEVISADSMQIYRHMDIGTAKPSLEEMSSVPHHMIDIVEPWEYFSAGQYLQRVSGIIAELHHRGLIPIITGGTGLYMKALTRGLFTSPPADLTFRAELLQKEKGSPGYLLQSLKEIDPVAASRIAPNDHRRLIRALEVYHRTKRPISHLQAQETVSLDYDYIKIGITRPRQELYEIINRRVDAMIEKGLIEEVKGVIETILNHSPCPTNKHELEHLFSFTSMQAIGYKEIARSIYGEIDLDRAITLIKQRTRNYAKRQFTWFRDEEDIVWIEHSALLRDFGQILKGCNSDEIKNAWPCKTL